MKLHVFDVGHGDSIVLEFPDGKSFAVIDCNRSPIRGGGTKGARTRGIKALRFFRDLVKRGCHPVVEFVCLTHPHYDHYNGLSAVIQGLIEMQIPIREYWDFGASVRKAKAMAAMAVYAEQVENAKELERLCTVKQQLIEEQNCVYKIIVCPQKNLWHGQDVVVDAIAPAAIHTEVYFNYLGLSTISERRQFLALHPDASDDNAVCSGLLIRYDLFRLVLGADLTNAAWKEVLGFPGKTTNYLCHGLKVSHHGSMEGNYPDRRTPICKLLTTSDGIEQHALISGGYRSKLPDPSVVSAFRSNGVNVYCTGPMTNDEPVLYAVATAENDTEVQAILEADGVYEFAEKTGSGHGDMVLECLKNGTGKVKTEFPGEKLESS